MTIYMIKSEKYYTIHGLWTDLNQMLEWISAQTDSWDERTGETDLDEFMNENYVMEYQDGDGYGKCLPWKEIIPQD